MSLETYHAKRDFKSTPEPRGRKGRKGGASFVVQKHAARRLHYDFRLEHDGVLLSWAVTRGPSLVPSEKRLAVRVEDHPLDYGGFEGTIPKGEYGGGTVMLWDRGTWTPEFDIARGLKKGHLEFTLQGEKLNGRWHLVRMAPRQGESRENWLLIKGDDAYAQPEDAPDILDAQPLSVDSGRDMAAIAKGGKPKPQKKPQKKPRPRAPSGPETAAGAKPAKLPAFVEPMLARLVAAAPEGDEWLHEIKFDGYRLQARIDGGKVRLLTRSGLDWTEKFGAAVPKALAALPVERAIIDGELVVENDAGASDFSALQADLSEGTADRFVFYAFDLMHQDGSDLRAVPLETRKALLTALLPAGKGVLRLSEPFGESGAMVLRHACRLSLEGIVSKRRDSAYRAGRGKAWVKSKCSARQEFVIGGYVPSTVSKTAIGSLILGVYEGDDLVHVGRVGTGFSNAVAETLFKRLDAITVDDSPFASKLTATEARQARFVTPELVAEVEFRAWTADGHLRHAAFRGLREDKPAHEITREAPPAAARTKAAPPPKRTVKLTHPDRVYWPDAGVTKEGLADYYAAVWRWIAPWITGRPLALLRCPDGIKGPHFFQKHPWKGMNPAIRRLIDPKDDEPMVGIDDLDGLMALAQSAALEIHPWGSTAADWERPDLIVMDLDPGEGVDWATIVSAAQELRGRLKDKGLQPFVKTSGGKGLHVVAPLEPKAGWPAVKAFTKALAQEMAADSPDRYVATISKAQRKGRILIDYLRNQRGATAVAAYSTRARPGATVSAPLTWSELDDPAVTPQRFTVDTMPARLDALPRDPWAGFRKAAVPLPGK